MRNSFKKLSKNKKNKVYKTISNTTIENVIRKNNLDSELSEKSSTIEYFGDIIKNNSFKLVEDKNGNSYFKY